MHHLPVGDPFAAGSLALFALGAGHGPFHGALDAFGRANRDVWLHPSLPQRVPSARVRSVDRPSDAVLIVPHVSVGHRDGIDVRIDEARVPGHRIGHAVDVIPAPRVESDEVFAERRPNLHQLKHRLELFDQHVDLDLSDRNLQEAFERGDHLVPERRLFGGLDLRQIQDERRTGVPQALEVVDDVQRHVHDRGGEAAAAGPPDVPVVQMQASSAKDLGREIELHTPVTDDRAAEEPARPFVHLSPQSVRPHA